MFVFYMVLVKELTARAFSTLCFMALFKEMLLRGGAISASLACDEK
jgi:hypothetical protein